MVLKSDVVSTRLLTTNMDHTNGSSRIPIKGKTGGRTTGVLVSIVMYTLTDSGNRCTVAHGVNLGAVSG